MHYLTLVILVLIGPSLHVSALPNLAQEYDRPEGYGGRVLIAPIPLPGLEPIIKLDSDLLCADVYEFWEDFLFAWFDPPIANAVQSSSVDYYKKVESGKKFMIVYCKDVRKWKEWLEVNHLQRLRMAEEEERVRLATRWWSRTRPRPAWKWLREDYEQGYWILQCPEGMVAKVVERKNRLKVLDTYGFCIPEWEDDDEDRARVPKLWWEENVALKHSNHPYNSEPGEAKGLPGFFPTICRDVSGPSRQSALLKIKAALLFVTIGSAGIGIKCRGFGMCPSGLFSSIVP